MAEKEELNKKLEIELKKDIEKEVKQEIEEKLEKKLDKNLEKELKPQIEKEVKKRVHQILEGTKKSAAEFNREFRNQIVIAITAAFGFLIAGGVGINILFQTVVNIGMNIGLLPITGITLPLISYGGSSLIITLISLGLVASVAKNRRKVDIEKN